MGPENHGFRKKFNTYVTMASLLIATSPAYLNNSGDYQSYLERHEEMIDRIDRRNMQNFLNALDRYVQEQRLREKLANSTGAMGIYMIRIPEED
jgi:esterase/lipase superfamily enzyme